MCNHHFDGIAGEDVVDHHEPEADQQQSRTLKEDSFEVPDNRTAAENSEVKNQSSLETDHGSTPFYSYHAEKAHKQVRLELG